MTGLRTTHTHTHTHTRLSALFENENEYECEYEKQHALALLDSPRSACKSSLVFSRLARVLLIVALLGATGTHWLVLQSVAWTTMFADNLRSGSVSDAIVRTFDGRHPCRLCRQIATGKQGEKKSDVRLEWKKLEFSYTLPVFQFKPPLHFPGIQSPIDSANPLTHAPPVPPPRRLPG